MHTYTSRLLALSALFLFSASCNQGTHTESKTTDSTATATMAPPKAIMLADVSPSPEFPDAQLTLGSATAAKAGTDSAKVSFTFNVKNYELKNQTADAGSKLCNNSDKGQHIHFILDNKPYAALYDPKQDVTLPLNSEHYLMCFLSRSYHESIKSKGAAFLYHFKIDQNGSITKMPEAKTPMLFYSRPKGDYLGKDTANILLDFYVWNTTLGKDSRVKAEVKNETSGANMTFNITEWKPRFIQNLGTGKATVTLSLLDKDGKQMEGPNTQVTRNFQLAAQEPLK